MNFFDKQIGMAKNNYNYFFMRLLSGILKIICKLAIMLLVSNIFNFLIINIIVLIYTIYSLFSIYNLYNYYIEIMGDIKNTLCFSDFLFKFDFSNRIFKGMVKYGK